jgi:hypothetical protein
MEGLKRQIRYQVMDSKKAFIIFWGIAIAVNILFYWLNAISDSNSTFGTGEIITVVESNGSITNTRYLNVAGSNIIAIGIFIIVYNMIMYYEAFPMAIGFSSTRKNFYLGAVVHNSVLCLAMAAVEGILLKLDRYIITAMGEKYLDKFLMFNLKSNNILYTVVILFLVFLLICSVFNLLGAILYKYGYKFWIGFFAISIISANIRFNKPVLILKNSVNYILKFDGVLSFSVKIILTSAVLYGIGWLLIRRRVVRSGK